MRTCRWGWLVWVFSTACNAGGNSDAHDAGSDDTGTPGTTGTPDATGTTDGISGDPRPVAEMCVLDSFDGEVSAEPTGGAASEPLTIVFSAGEVTTIAGEDCEATRGPSCSYHQGYETLYCVRQYVCEGPVVPDDMDTSYVELAPKLVAGRWLWRAYSFYAPYTDDEGSPYEWTLGPMNPPPSSPCVDETPVQSACSRCLENCRGLAQCCQGAGCICDSAC